ncbi:MAG TPA: chromate transporter [Clostridiaceae bacterium]|nr:chromate transporter [Clostridiaceae bacterium]
MTFFKLGAISFGGGYAMIPLIEGEVVENKKWVDKEKIVDIFAVAESLPGAIAINTSAFVGYSIAGIPGTVAALLGNLTPSVFIILVLSIMFAQVSSNTVVKSAFRGIYPAIVGLICYAGYKIGRTSVKDIFSLCIMVLAFVAATFLNIEPIPIIISGAILGVILAVFKTTKRVKNEKRKVKEK